MARDKKLKAALDRYKGVDHKLERQKKLQKEAKKRKQNRSSKISELREEEYMMSGALIPLEEKKELVFEGKENGEKQVQNEAAPDEENLWDTDDEDEDEQDEVLEVPKIRSRLKSLIFKTNKLKIDISKLDESESSDEEDEEQNTTTAIVQNGTNVAPGKIASEDSAINDEEDIPLSDVASIASEEKGDIVAHQRLTINNTTALLAAHKRIALPLSKLPFSAHQSITSSDSTVVGDINDDLKRELAFYKQSLSAAQEARRLLKAEDVPFSRPTDYFAEMVKSDEHMGRVRQKLVDVAASKKAAAEARKQRDLKKFGKQVQVEKRQERERTKKETLERIQSLKRSMSTPVFFSLGSWLHISIGY